MLTKETVEKVSKLARLKLTDQEMQLMSQQLSIVLENFEQLKLVATEGVRPLVTPTDMTASLRSDEVESVVPNEKLLMNAPEKSGHLFKVPPVVG